MRFTRAMIRAALNNDREAMSTLAPVVARCAAAGAARVNARNRADDVEQELWIFLMNHVDRLDEDYNLEPYLIRTARFLALSHSRKFPLFGTEGEDLRHDPAGLDGRPLDDLDVGDPAVGEVDQAAALRMLVAKEPGLLLDPKKKAPVKKVAAKKRELAPDQKEIRALRIQLGLTQPAMAMRLGLQLPAYQAYEYGRTKGVPKRVMDAARKLQMDESYSVVQEKYAGRSISSIANEWAERMGLNRNSPAELARALGTNRSTASRWLSDSVSLSLAELAMYERRVEIEEGYHRASQERRRTPDTP